MVENIVRIGGIACYKQYLLFSQYFPHLYIFSASKCGIVWSWAKTITGIFHGREKKSVVNTAFSP